MILQQESLGFLTERQRQMLRRAMTGDVISRLWLAPWRAMETPDPWQVELLSQLVTLRDDVLLCCSSQIGKTEVVSVGAYLVACLGFYVLVVSPSDRQSIKFMSRLLNQHRRLNLVRQSELPNKHELWLDSGGHVEAVPNSPDKIRGIAAVDLLVVDEAARVPDVTYNSVTRMLAVSGGKKALLSTPFGRRGFFWGEWDKGNDWQRHEIPWTMCPRISPEFIESELTRPSGGQTFVDQEYCCKFLSSGAGVFDPEAYAALVDPSLQQLQW
jgi:hypothetical protein